MTRDIVANIISLKKSIHQALLQKHREPIFNPVVENEHIVLQLTRLNSQNEKDFSDLVELLYKFLIECSGNGARLPEDTRIDVMDSTIRELRNHYSHARENGEEKEVKRKFRKVGEIYRRLMGKRVPSIEQDWVNAQISLLKLAEDGLERTFELVSQEEAPRNLPIFEDNDVLLIAEKNKQFSFQSGKRGSYEALSDIPVFVPQFALSPIPAIGRDGAVYATSRPPMDGSIEQFFSFLKDIEQKWRSALFLISTYDEYLNWSISDDGHFAFGCGANNLAKELLRHKRVAIGAVLYGFYGEDYSKTCFMVISGYRKGDRIRDICADIYLSCIPTDWELFNSLLRPFQNLYDEPIKISHFSILPLSYSKWEPKGHERVSLQIIGGLRREGYGKTKIDRETDQYSGVIVKPKSLHHVQFNADSNLYGESLSDEDIQHLNPIFQLKEVVVSITNTVPYCDEVETNAILSVNQPKIKVIHTEAYGTSIHIINIHCTGPKFKKK